MAELGQFETILCAVQTSAYTPTQLKACSASAKPAGDEASKFDRARRSRPTAGKVCGLAKGRVAGKCG